MEIGGSIRQNIWKSMEVDESLWKYMEARRSKRKSVNSSGSWWKVQLEEVDGSRWEFRQAHERRSKSVGTHESCWKFTTLGEVDGRRRKSFGVYGSS